MSQITILFLYAVAAAAFAGSRLPRFESRAATWVTVGFVLGIVAVALDANALYATVFTRVEITLGRTISLIGLQLGVISLFAALKPALRGLAAGLLVLAALMALAPGFDSTAPARTAGIDWQMRTHVLTSLFAYALLTAGAIVALFALVQERRLKSARISPASRLFAPLETTENLLYAVTMAGFAILALSVITGFTFVEDLFAQHLAHKTILSLLALLVFGVLLLGRHFAGWRGRRAVFLYLAGFALLCLAYYGSRLILETLGRSWS